MSLDAERPQASRRSGAGRRALAAITLTVTAVLGLAACASPAPPAVSTPADAVAVTLPTARFSQVTLRTTSSSSGTGINSAAAGTADIGTSDAYLSPATLAKYPRLVNIPLAVAALMVVYNVPGITPATHLRLDGKLLARIYAGKITSWDDPAIGAVNPGVKLPGTGIVLVHRGDTSGSTFLFTSYLNAQDPSGWGSALIGTTVAWPRQPGELSAAAGTIQAALASFTNTPAGETISLVNGAGAQAYPIINYEYAIVGTAQASAVRARDLRAFLSWAITSGAAQLARVNFQPLPSSVVTLSGTQIAKIKG